jgi:hypothetical protein
MSPPSEYPPWSQSSNACETHQTDNCPECEEMHWNPELVAKLEAERAGGFPRRTPKAAMDTPDQLKERRRLAKEIARTKAG